MSALAYFMNLCSQMESKEPFFHKSTLMSAPSMEYKGRAFAMVYEDSIVLKIDGHILPETKTLGWQYFKPYGQPIYLQKWVAIPYYYHTDWFDLVQQALHDIKSSLGEA